MAESQTDRFCPRVVRGSSSSVAEADEDCKRAKGVASLPQVQASQPLHRRLRPRRSNGLKPSSAAEDGDMRDRVGRRGPRRWAGRRRADGRFTAVARARPCPRSTLETVPHTARCRRPPSWHRSSDGEQQRKCGPARDRRNACSATRQRLGDEWQHARRRAGSGATGRLLAIRSTILDFARTFDICIERPRVVHPSSPQARSAIVLIVNGFGVQAQVPRKADSRTEKSVGVCLSFGGFSWDRESGSVRFRRRSPGRGRTRVRGWDRSRGAGPQFHDRMFAGKLGLKTHPSARPKDDKLASSFLLALGLIVRRDSSTSGQPMNRGSRRPTLTNVSNTIDGSP